MPYHSSNIGITADDVIYYELQFRAHRIHELLKELKNRLKNKMAYTDE